MIWGGQTIREEIKCGRHSGFSWCCVLWYIFPWKLILKYATWDGWQTWYHKLMDTRQPKTVIQDIKLKTENDPKSRLGFSVVSWKRVEVSDWGMIPCPLHLLFRKRSQVYTCFCPGNWKPEAKASVLKLHPELCVKE